MLDQFPYCSDYTPRKNAHFRDFMALHVKIWKAVTNKPTNSWIMRKYFYLDLNGGPGTYYDPIAHVGSPLIFSHLAEREMLDTQIFLVESNERTMRSLQESMCTTSLFRPDICYACRDNAEWIEELFIPSYAHIAKNISGIAYADPGGAGKREFLALKLLSEQFPRLDLLIHLQAAPIKRCNRAFKGQKGHLTLPERIAEIKKAKFIIREPYDKHQYSFLLATNWLKMPDYKRIGFHELDSARGSEIFNKLAETAGNGGDHGLD